MRNWKQEDIQKLYRFDSPTIANAIQRLGVRDPAEGYTSLELRCIYPEYKPMVGYAVTCMEDTASPYRRDNEPMEQSYRGLYSALDNSPKPSVLVVKNAGSDRLRSVHIGDIMATLCQRIGTAGVVTDGGIRDIEGVRERAPGFQMFACGSVASKGAPRLLDVGGVVSICGLIIRPGDLLFGDLNGLVKIPPRYVNNIVTEADKILELEAEKVEFVRGDDFSLEGWGERFGW